MNKPQIGIYGRMNVGKSSLLNFLTSQSISIVSDQAGTTTDPVKRGFEILNFSPVVFIDTAGIDDSSELGKKRTAKSLQTISAVDLAILVTDSPKLGVWEEDLIKKFNTHLLPYILVYNNFRISNQTLSANLFSANGASSTVLSSFTGDPEPILSAIKGAIPLESMVTPPFFGGRISKGDAVIMVCPIDSQAPSGRLILPQVQALRGALDDGAITLVVQPQELAKALEIVQNPRIVVTDSQLFGTIEHLIPQDVELTSFSILLSKLKGDPAVYKEALKKIESLKENDKIMILENCSHQTNCDDIGRVKIPRWLKEYTGIENLEFTILGPNDPLPDNFSQYSLAIQCGGCMVTRRAVQARIRASASAGVPITNYGMMIQYIKKQ